MSSSYDDIARSRREMSETIPKDIMALAYDAAEGSDGAAVASFNGVHIIARAILSERDGATAAEREACAKRVWDWRDYDGSTGDEYDKGYGDAIVNSIASIRKGAE